MQVGYEVPRTSKCFLAAAEQKAPCLEKPALRLILRLGADLGKMLQRVMARVHFNCVAVAIGFHIPAQML